MEHTVLRLAQGLSDVLGRGEVAAVAPGTMADGEQGFSGASVSRVLATYRDGGTASMILKSADLKERMAMERLTRQGHAHTPAAFSLDATTDAPQPMMQEDVGPTRTPPPGKEWLPDIASALAGIHARSLGCGADMPWLPRADRAYWTYLVTQISVDHFEALMRENAAFEQEFGGYLPLLRARAAAFVRDMTDLSAEADGMTLTHGDLQTIDGDHIHYRGGTPYVIDFGWCRYAPLYVDLATFFADADARLYFDALAAHGVPLRWPAFEDRLRAARRYGGFIYLYPALRQWGTGPTAQTGKRLLRLLKIMLTGGFPVCRTGYPDALFARLLAEHRQGVLADRHLI